MQPSDDSTFRTCSGYQQERTIFYMLVTNKCIYRHETSNCPIHIVCLKAILTHTKLHETILTIKTTKLFLFANITNISTAQVKE